MRRYTPTLIVLTDAFAHKIGDRTKQMLCERLGFETPPPIFQFLNLSNEKIDEDEIARCYASALSMRAIAESERMLPQNIDASRLETYIVAPMHPLSCQLALEISKVVDSCALETVAGGRNAVFLTARRILQLNQPDSVAAAQILDAAMQKKMFPFNRCFFIDEVNELGETITMPEDIVDLVANFIALALASDLAEALRNNPAPYGGAGARRTAYASFSCNTITLDKTKLVQGLSQYLARDICQNLSTLKSSQDKNELLLDSASQWMLNNLVTVEEHLNLRPAVQANDVAAQRNSAHQKTYEATLAATQQRFAEYMHATYKSLDYDLGTFRCFLENCLERWLVHLEAHATKARSLRKNAAEGALKALLKIPGQEPFTDEVLPSKKWWQALTRTKPKPIKVPRLRAVPPEKALLAALATHAIQSAAMSIHLDLILQLEAACANIDLLQRRVESLSSETTNRLFDIDLVDQELVQKLYHSKEYASRTKDIEGFVSSIDFKSFRDKLFVFPDGDPHNYLFDYCKKCFDFARGYKVDEICELKRTLSEQKSFLHLSTPFWKPLNIAVEEKTTIVSAEKRLDLNSVLASQNKTATELHVDSTNSDGVSVVQVAYGIDLQDLLGFSVQAEPSPPKQERAVSASSAA